VSTNAIAKALKSVFEKVTPDLREYMRPGATGKVVAVYEDTCRVDIEVTNEDVSPGEPWILPEVPVSQIAGGDGYGAWAIPESGSEVSVSFKDFDITQPRLDGAEYLNNRTPIGARVGSFVFSDQAGQRIILRPDEGQIVFRTYNADDETSGTRNEKTGGAKSTQILGDHNEDIGGNHNRTVRGNVTETIEDGQRDFISDSYEERSNYEEGGRTFQHGRIVHGSEKIKVEGGQDTQVGGDGVEKVLGSKKTAVTKAWQIIVGGKLDIVVANTELETIAVQIATLVAKIAIALDGTVEIESSKDIKTSSVGETRIEAIGNALLNGLLVNLGGEGGEPALKGTQTRLWCDTHPHVCPILGLSGVPSILTTPAVESLKVKVL